jgi:hypothetical protein
MLKPLILAALVFTLTASAAPLELHVAPTGDDAAAGTAQAPFGTLERARDEVRAHKADSAREGATVWLHQGVFARNAPFELTAADSGAPDAPIVYRAVEGADVRISGGASLDLDRFSPVISPEVLARLVPEARGHVLQLPLRDAAVGDIPGSWADAWWDMRRTQPSLLELFADGRRLPLARWPNEGYAQFGDIVEAAAQEGKLPKFRYTDPHPERWDVSSGVWLFGYWYRAYRAEFVRVREIDRDAHTIELAARNSLGGLDTAGARRFMAINLLEELDAPGEWYLDPARGVLYLWPPDGLQDKTVTVSVAQPSLVHCVRTTNLEFRNLAFEFSRADAIQVEGGRDVRIVACEVSNVARAGIAMTGDANAIIGCDIHDTGTDGIDFDGGDRASLTGGGGLIDNNHIHHTNRIARAGMTAVSIGGVGHRFSHNLIHDTGYIAVRFSGNDHMIEYNRLFRTNVETTEGGVFYTGRDWTSRGTTIRYNFVHHVEDSQEGFGSATRFVHLDDSAPGIHIYGNVCYRMGGGVSVCGGADNDVHDNLFVECLNGGDIGPRGADMFSSDGNGGFTVNPNRWNWDSLAKRLSQCKYKEPPYSTKYPRLKEIFYKNPIAAPWFNVIRHNLVVDCGATIKINGMQPEWSTIEDNWELADPGFVEPDHTRLNFALKPDAEAYKLGFQPLPFDQIGLYASADRRTWPVALELPPADWKPRWMHLREMVAKSPGALPIFKVMPVESEITIDGTVDPMEWTPGDATGKNPDIHEVASLEWRHDKARATHPSQALMEVDGANLYVGFRNDVDPAAGVTGGHAWGKDDAVEIAIAQVTDKIGPIIVLRGYADGYFESSDEAGAPASVVERARQGVEYAAHVAGPAFWSAEWKIPFAALGINPAVANPRLVFNLSARKPAGDEWVMWKKVGGSTWDVARSGSLWLAPFGEVTVYAGVPSEAILDIDGRAAKVMLTAGAGCEIADWATPVGGRATCTASNLAADHWTDMLCEFTPQSDGMVQVRLRGNSLRVEGSNEDLPVWSYFDDIRVEGATLINGDFETPGDRGLPAGWSTELGKAYWITDSKLAASGEHCVKVWNLGRFTQQMRVTANQKVTIRARVRGSGGG